MLEKKREKRLENPIYLVMKRIMNKKIDAPEISSALKLKMSDDGQQYFMVSLDQETKTERHGNIDCQITEHHLSVYETYDDKVFVRNAYHYTAKILVDDSLCTLHTYFDKFGRLLDYLVSDEFGETVKDLDEWQDTFRKISLQYTINVLSQVYLTFEKLSLSYEQRLEAINSNIDILSEQLYGDYTGRKDLESVSKTYLNAIKMYIDCMNEYNEVSLYKDRTKTRFLQTVLDNFKIPKITERPVGRDKKQAAEVKLKTFTVQQKPTEKIKKTVKEKYSEIIPLIPEDIQSILSRLQELEKIKTTDSLLEQHQLLSECTARMKEVPDNVAMDIFIQQNQLLIKVRSALNLCVKYGKFEAVKFLLPLVPIVNQEMISIAAMNNHTEVLLLLLKFYKGPKRIFQCIGDEISRELVCHEKLPTVSLQILLNYGCDKFTLDVYGRSLLLIAVMLDDLERVRMLLDAKVDVNQYSSKAHRVVVRPIVSIPDDVHISAKEARIMQREMSEFEVTQSRLANQSVQTMSLTPIMCAVQRGHLAIIGLLKEHGCDLSIVHESGFNTFGYTLIRPVTNAHYRLKPNVIQYLIDECHLDINMMHGHPHMRKTALHHIVHFRNYSNTVEHAVAILDDVEVLLKFNADPNIESFDVKDNDRIGQLCPFTQAVIFNYSDIVDLIFRNSKVLISDKTYQHAVLIIEALRPHDLEGFSRQYQHHVHRLRPQPRVSQDPNTFFNSENSIKDSGLSRLGDEVPGPH